MVRKQTPAPAAVFFQRKARSMAALLGAVCLSLSSVPVHATSDTYASAITFAPSREGLTAASVSCRLLDRNTVQFTAELKKTPGSDDGKLYLYQLKTYQYDIPVGSTPIASCDVTTTPAISFSLGSTDASGRLYCKFALASISKGVPVILAEPQYISNPEVLATHNKARNRAAKTTQAQSLTNLCLTGTGYCGVMPNKTAKTAQILCKGDSALVHPSIRDGAPDSHPIDNVTFYMANTAEDAAIAGIVKDLQNYAANSNCQDYIIGNEVNERIWNYSAWTNWNDYMRDYVREFRVCYTAIKSVNANANIYLSLDQNWNRNNPPGHWEYTRYIDVKDFLMQFNSAIRKSGNIDWCLSIHPYTVPLDYAKFWDYSGSANPGLYKPQIPNNYMVSFQNMSVVTDFMCRPDMLAPSGNVRDIIINEIGIDATQGEDVQLAALCASYKSFEMNPYITQYMYLDVNGNGVNSLLSERGWQVFNSFGTPAEEEYMEWAKQYIGIKDWSEIIR